MTLRFIVANDYRWAMDGTNDICSVSFTGNSREEIVKKIQSQIPDSRVEDNYIFVEEGFNKLMRRLN